MSYYANGGGKLIVKKNNFDKVVEAYHTWTAEFGSDSSDMKDIKAIFEDQWFEVGFNDDGDLYWVDFPYEKYRDEGDFIEMLVPWIENGSYMDFTGEDGALWRISVYNHKYYETSWVVMYPGDPYEEEK